MNEHLHRFKIARMMNRGTDNDCLENNVNNENNTENGHLTQLSERECLCDSEMNGLFPNQSTTIPCTLFSNTGTTSTQSFLNSTSLSSISTASSIMTMSSGPQSSSNLTNLENRLKNSKIMPSLVDENQYVGGQHTEENTNKLQMKINELINEKIRQSSRQIILRQSINLNENDINENEFGSNGISSEIELLRMLKNNVFSKSRRNVSGYNPYATQSTEQMNYPNNFSITTSTGYPTKLISETLTTNLLNENKNSYLHNKNNNSNNNNVEMMVNPLPSTTTTITSIHKRNVPEFLTTNDICSNEDFVRSLGVEQYLSKDFLKKQTARNKSLNNILPRDNNLSGDDDQDLLHQNPIIQNNLIQQNQSITSNDSNFNPMEITATITNGSTGAPLTSSSIVPLMKSNDVTEQLTETAITEKHTMKRIQDQSSLSTSSNNKSKLKKVDATTNTVLMSLDDSHKNSSSSSSAAPTITSGNFNNIFMNNLPLFTSSSSASSSASSSSSTSSLSSSSSTSLIAPPTASSLTGQMNTESYGNGRKINNDQNLSNTPSTTSMIVHQQSPPTKAVPNNNNLPISSSLTNTTTVQTVMTTFNRSETVRNQQEKRKISTEIKSVQTEEIDEFRCLQCRFSALNNNNNNNDQLVNETDDKLYKDIMGVFECPVCFESVTHPIYQCNSGHIYCHECGPILTSCPVCRGGLNEIRNLALEKIASLIFTACIYASGGCRVALPFNEIVKHQKYCQYRTFQCPCPGNLCEWKGRIPDILTHIHSQHKAITTLTGPEIVFLVTEIDLHGGADWVMLQRCYKKTFMLILEKELNEKNSKSSFHAIVQILGTKKEAENFTYKLELKKDSRQLSWESNCWNIVDGFDHAVHSSHSFYFDSKTAKDFADAGNLAINVTIHRLS
ncbi:hypothetical protein SNEBB_003284 [Seison nebaliae]|nr:hypothetical protein SNEBB_003284 [Seison nebaliae]